MALRVWNRHSVPWGAVCRPDHARGPDADWSGKWIWSAATRARDCGAVTLDCTIDCNLFFGLESSAESKRISVVSDRFCDLLVRIPACDSHELLWVYSLSRFCFERLFLVASGYPVSPEENRQNSRVPPH